MDNTSEERYALASLTLASNLWSSPRGRSNRVKHIARVAAEYMQLLYHVSKAREESCAFIDVLQWVCEISFSTSNHFLVEQRKRSALIVYIQHCRLTSIIYSQHCWQACQTLIPMDVYWRSNDWKFSPILENAFVHMMFSASGVMLKMCWGVTSSDLFWRKYVHCISSSSYLSWIHHRPSTITLLRHHGLLLFRRLLLNPVFLISCHLQDSILGHRTPRLLLLVLTKILRHLTCPLSLLHRPSLR